MTARAAAVEQIVVACSQPATRDRSRSRHSADASESDGESCTILNVTTPAVRQSVAQVKPPDAPLFQLGGQDA